MSGFKNFQFFNSVDHYAVFHLSLPGLSKYPFRIYQNKKGECDRQTDRQFLN